MKDYNFTQLEDKLQEILTGATEKQGEYELLKALQQAKFPGFPAQSLSQTLPLFRMHFLLYHALYRLRDGLWDRREGHLEISPLHICLLPYRKAPAWLTEADPLRDYYLDLSHLHKTTEAGLNGLLGEFWARFHAGGQRQAALEVLGLQEPVNYSEIKRQYRSLAMLHHPDRGGDKRLFQAINTAMGTLKRGSGCS